VSAVVLIVLVVLLVVVGGAIALARQAKKDATLPVSLAPGAPASWAGAHTPEARLHRRLVDAVAALPREDVNVLEARLAIEQLARAVDEQLVTVSKLPERVRAEPLAQVTAAVEAVEDGVARVAANELGAAGAAAVESALAQLTERVQLLDQARRELE